jgi:hypothetical protein
MVVVAVFLRIIDAPDIHHHITLLQQLGVSGPEHKRT